MMKLLISKDISLTSSHAWSLTNFRNFILKKILRTCSGKRNIAEKHITRFKCVSAITFSAARLETVKLKNYIENVGAGSSKPALSMSTQTARATVTCIECRKPGVTCSSKKLDFRHNVILARNITSFEYSCGAHLFPPSEKRKLAVSFPNGGGGGGG